MPLRKVKHEIEQEDEYLESDSDDDDEVMLDAIFDRTEIESIGELLTPAKNGNLRTARKSITGTENTLKA